MRVQRKVSSAFAQKVVRLWNEPPVAGNADVLVRTERAARIYLETNFPLKSLSVLAHAVRTRTSAFPALTDSVQWLNEFLAKPFNSTTDLRYGFTPKREDANTKTLRNKRIPGCVAKNPEENNRSNPGPEVERRYENSPLRLSGNGAFGKARQSIDQKRQRHHRQRIQFEGRHRMQVQQLIACPRRAATGALQSGYQAKRTFRKKLIRGI